MTTKSSTFINQNAFAVLMQVLGVLSNLVFNVALPIFLGAVVFGKLSLSLGIAYFVVGLSEIGLNNAALAILSKYSSKKDRGKFIYSFYRLFSIRLGLSFVLAAITFSSSYFIASIYGVSQVSVQMSSLLIIFYSGSVFLNSFFMAINKNEALIKTSLLNGILLIVLPLAAYFAGFRLAGIIAAVVITFVIVFARVLVLTRASIASMNVKPEPIGHRELFFNILAFSTTSFSNVFLTWGILLILGLFVASEKVAFFKVSLSWILAIISIIPISSGLVLSAVSGMKDNERRESHFLKILKYGFIITVPAMFGLFLLGPKLMKAIYGVGYAEAGSVITILCWAVLPFFLNSVLLCKLSASSGLRKIAYVYFSTTVLGFLATILLSSAYGVTGAALSLLLVIYSITAISYYFTGGKIETIKLLSRPLMASLMMGAAVFLLLPFAYSLVNGVLIMLFAIAVYFTLLFAIGGFGIEDVRKIGSIWKP